MAKVFISYDFDDKASFDTVKNWKSQGIGHDISIESHSEKYPATVPEDQLLASIIKRLERCQVVLVLVGNNTHDKYWVDKEIKAATGRGKKVIWTRINGTTGAAPREIRSQTAVPFTLQDIQQAIRLAAG